MSPNNIFLSETIEDVVDDDQWKEDLWEEIKGESVQQIQQHKANNHKVTTAHEKGVKSRGKKTEEELQTCHCHNCSQPRCVPDGVGVVTVGQFLEHDNVFHGLLACHFYYSPYSDRMYARRTTVAAK